MRGRLSGGDVSRRRRSDIPRAGGGRATPESDELDFEVERLWRLLFDFFLHVEWSRVNGHAHLLPRVGLEAYLGDSPEAIEHPFAGAARSEYVPEHGTHLVLPEDFQHLCGGRK
jgi:hypothetical protein